mmetsp:Transcript_115008/g.171890  ORF Transcript_115008/g.171890 Transcript_115008/m.171890 type:complete len:165 (-) Transcript_115008:145-639(-)
MSQQVADSNQEKGAAQEFWENPSTATFNEMILSPFRHDNRGKFNDWVPMGGEVDPKDGQGENKTFLDPALDLLRHKPGDGKESEKEISISAGYKSWLPYHPLPLDAVEKYKEKKDPWEKPKEAPKDTPTVVVVAQTALDCTLYAIPGVVGGIGLADTVIAKPEK